MLSLSNWRFATSLVLALLGTAPSPAAESRFTNAEVTWNNAAKAKPGLSHDTFYSDAMQREVGYSMALPDGYATGSRRYPVIYFLHGWGGDETSDGPRFAAIVADLARRGEIPPVICVFPNGGRAGYRDSDTDGVHVETMIVKELVPLIDRTYRTLPRRDARGLAGFSMGGAGSLHLALRYPEVFSGAGTWAAAIRLQEIDTVPELRSPDLRTARRVALLMIVGKQDFTQPLHVPALQALTAANYPFVYRTLPNVGHDLDAYFRLTGEDLARFVCRPFAAAVADETAEPTPAAFAAPPREVRPMVWWHWMNGAVTQDGIEKDLQAMKEAGLAGFQLFDVGLLPAKGPFRYGTPEWAALRRFALRRANELGLVAGLECTPGWSVAGGPWVSHEDSMKTLVWTETHVSGSIDRALPEAQRVKGLYRDVAVIAVRDSAEEQADASRSRPSVTAGSGTEDLSSLVDGDATTFSAFAQPAEGRPLALTFAYPAETTVQAVECSMPAGKWPLSAACELQASADGVEFRTVRKFHLISDHGMPTTSAASFAPVTARAFRLLITERTDRFKPVQLAEVRLRQAGRLDAWSVKSNQVLMDHGLHRMTANAAAAAGADTPAGSAASSSDVLDITSHMDAAGRLTWTAPAGSWTVYRFGYTSSGKFNQPAQPEATGPEIDKFDAGAVRRYFAQAMDGDFNAPGAQITSVTVDSWEGGPQNWSAAFPALFKQLRGYDITPWLPVFAGRIVGSVELSRRFLWDVRQANSQIIARNFFGVMQSESLVRGAALYQEPYDGPLNIAQVGAIGDIPTSEFWLGEREFNNLKNVASVAHATGLTRVAAESFTSMTNRANHSLGLADFKTTADGAFARGLNDTLLHSYVHQPYDEAQPGFALGPFGSQFNRHETWWPMMRGWTDYLARCQLLLRAGTSFSDIALLRVDDAPGMSHLDQYATRPPKGYDYDFIAPDDLLGATMSKGALVLRSGVRYRVLVLPESRCMRPDVAETLLSLVQDGLHVVGPAPQRAPGLADHATADRRVAAVSARLWGDMSGSSPGSRKVGQGSVSVGRTMEEALAALQLPPDFDAVADSSKLRFCHRQTASRDVYFVANVDETSPAELSAAFRVKAESAEFWDPLSGKISAAPITVDSVGRATVSLRLAARQSIFVVFPKRGSETPGIAVQRTTSPAMRVEGPWLLAFHGAHAPAPVLGELHSLATHKDESVRHFAGVVSYRRTVHIQKSDWQPGQPAWLDLGRVSLAAEVSVNGKSCGVAWVAPYRVDVASSLQVGDNDVEVRVAVPWVNRLISDAARSRLRYDEEGNLAEFPDWLLAPDRSSAPEAKLSFSAFRYFNGDEPLVDAGLLGPVTLEFGR